MPWVRFTADFDFKVRPQLMIAYRRGKRHLVSQACAKAAIDAGKAEPLSEDECRKLRRKRATDAG